MFVPLVTPTVILSQLQYGGEFYGYGFVYLTDVAPFAVPPNTPNPLSEYANNPSFKLVYQNPDVLIYQIVVNYTPA